MFLPRNVDLNQLAELSLTANPPWSLEVFSFLVRRSGFYFLALFSYSDLVPYEASMPLLLAVSDPILSDSL